MRLVKRAFLALAIVAGAASAVVPGPARAAGEGVKLPEVAFPFEGFFGTFDRAALQRGFQVYKEVCAGCHSMSLVSYRNLADLGFNEDEVKAIAAQYEVTDGPNEEGEMFQRKALPSDRFKAPFANDNAARAANNGALPPDLSLMAKARLGGPDYLHALLTGYKEPPAGFEVPEGQYYNAYFEGHKIAMPPPLTAGGVTYADGTNASVEQMSLDVSQFMMWAAEPHLEKRHQMGLKVVLFLLFFAAVMYAVKRKVWADVKH
ncbi:MAG TPA: cytochrome c1 [Alphaproteobacteria bacterium]|nr:cytochrome c1 [Alphaproteobacteria bacterium]